MNLSNARHINIDGKNVVRIDLNGDMLWAGLPEGYTPIEYIEVTGSQYVDLDFIPNQDTRIVCEFMYKGGSGIYGARDSVSSDNFSLRVINSKWQLGYGDGVLTGTIPCDTTNWHIADQNKNQLFIDGELAAEREYEVFNAPYPASIGAIHGSKIYYGEGLYRHTKVYDNGVLVRGVLPCKDPNGEVGMYDYVAATFRGGLGTNPLIAGPEL